MVIYRDILDFYETFNINRELFGRIARVSDKALDKYENEEKMRYKTIHKINKVMYLMECHELVCPEYESYKDKNLIEYKNKCVEILKSEGVF